MAHCDEAQRAQTGLDKPVDAMAKTSSCHSGLTVIAPLVVDMLHDLPAVPADGMGLLPDPSKSAICAPWTVQSEQRDPDKVSLTRLLPVFGALLLASSAI